jgi:hypothetical protein
MVAPAERVHPHRAPTRDHVTGWDRECGPDTLSEAGQQWHMSYAFMQENG